VPHSHVERFIQVVRGVLITAVREKEIPTATKLAGAIEDLF
jgi:hypothetical protein